MTEAAPLARRSRLRLAADLPCRALAALATLAPAKGPRPHDRPMTAAVPFRRPRAEACDRLTAATLRPLVQPEAQACTLPGGQLAGLEWRELRHCYGGRGRALLVRCPDCAAPSRVLWRPPGRGWGCWRCCPVSHPSHRRPGRHRRHRRPGGCAGKPEAWDRERLGEEQERIALQLLGLREGSDLFPWIPPSWRNRLPLAWNRIHVGCLPRRPDASRLTHRRREALAARISALEHLRLIAVLEACPFRDRLLPPDDMRPELMRLAAVWKLEETAWAVRRPAGDPRWRWPDESPGQHRQRSGETARTGDGPHRRAGDVTPASRRKPCATGPDGPRHRDPHRTPVERLTGF